MKKSSWKLILIIVAGILAVVMLGVFGVLRKIHGN